MGLLSYFGKQTYTIYIENYSAYFEPYNKPENGIRLDYKAMFIHVNRHNGFGEDYYDSISKLLNPPIHKVIKTSSDLFALRHIVDDFNDEQANDLYYRVSKKIAKGNLCYHNSDHPFPIKFRFNNNILGYPENYERSKWDDWYMDAYGIR